MTTDEGDRVDCSHCETSVLLEQASVLNKKDSKGLWRYLCPDCLQDIRVPAGYELVRDVSFLRGGGSAAEVLGDQSPDETTLPDGDDGESTPSGQNASILADFRGRFVTAEMDGGELTPGRIMMDRHRLVLATEAYRASVPLATVTDVVPPSGADSDAGDDGILALTYGGDEDTEMAFIGASRGTLSRFTTILFRVLIGGTAVRFDGQGPESVHDGTLHVHESHVELEADDRTRSIPIPATDVTPAGSGRHPEGAALTITPAQGRDEPAGTPSNSTTVALPTAKGRRLLGRLLRSDLEG
jgi:hypothetical protein